MSSFAFLTPSPGRTARQSRTQPIGAQRDWFKRQMFAVESGKRPDLSPDRAALCNAFAVPADLKVEDAVRAIGPFGAGFLMPNHPRSSIGMICTGAGSAPMRAMTEWRRRLRASGGFEGGRLMLLFGARSREELPCFGPLMKSPKDVIDVNLACSRTPGAPKRHVQDRMRERAADPGELLRSPDTCICVCGLKSMEQPVLPALRDVARQAGLRWEDLAAALRREGRLHLETH